MTVHDTLARIAHHGVIMVSRASSADDALRSVDAARDGGIRVIEVTFSVPEAATVIRRLASDSDIVVGAGTVLTTAQADEALEAGAEFLVSPGFDEAIVRFADDRNVLMVPGIYTASEAMLATEAGAAAVKLFPASSVGPGYLAALKAPLPHMNFIPSGGVASGNAAAWIDAGATAVGIAGPLSPRGRIDEAMAAGIRNEAAAAMAAVGAARNL